MMQWFHKGSLKLLCVATVLVLNLSTLSGQPIWSAGQPIVTAHPIYLDLSFDLNLNANVYWVVFPYTLSTSYPANTIKSWARTVLPFGDIIQNGVYPFSTPGTTQTVIIEGLSITQMVTSNHNYTVILVAESSPGVFSPVVYRNIITPPCPKIDILTGFSQPVTCITSGATATFQVVLIDPPTSGILKGTQWAFDWGDGTTASYTSTADYDVPPLVMRRHTYTSISSCN